MIGAALGRASPDLFVSDQPNLGREKKGELMRLGVAPLHDSILNAWSTNDRVTTFLVEQLPDSLWDAAVPGSPRRTIRMIAGHMHNAPCMWIKTLGKPHGVAVPQAVDRHRATRSQLVGAPGAQWTGDRQPTGPGA